MLPVHSCVWNAAGLEMVAREIEPELGLGLYDRTQHLAASAGPGGS